MKYFYQGLILDEAVHEIPETAVKLTDAEWAELMAARQAGGTVESDKQGRPVIVPFDSTSLAALQQRLVDQATEHRWTVETGGLMLPGGVLVATSIEDQNRITSVVANAERSGVMAVDFKATSGWVSVTLQELQAIAAAIALHVQACFTAERRHHEAIAALVAAEDRTALEAYNVLADWPGGAGGA